MRIASSAAVVALSLIAAVPTCGADRASTSAPPAAIFVANPAGDYVTVYPLGTNGDVPPLATIDGAATRLASPEAIALDSKGNIYVLNEKVANAGDDAGSSIVVFAAGGKANASPIATIAGPHTGLWHVDSIAVDSSGNIYVGARVGKIHTIEAPAGVFVFGAGSNGDVTPQATITGPNTEMNDAFGIAVDPKGTIFVADSRRSVLLFAAGSNGNAKPSAMIRGDKTYMDSPIGVALDPRGNVYVASTENGDDPSRITVYPAGSSGDVAPIATIDGTNTGFFSLQPHPNFNMITNYRTVRGIALDSEENLYVTSRGDDGKSNISVFAHGSYGDVKPIATIAGDSTGLFEPNGIAIGSYSGSR